MNKMNVAGKLGVLLLSILVTVFWVFGAGIGFGLGGPVEDADFVRMVVLVGLPIPLPIGILFLLFFGKPRHQQASTPAERLAWILGWVFFALPFIAIFLAALWVIANRILPRY